MNTRQSTWVRRGVAAVGMLAALSSPLYAVRTNMIKDPDRLEQMGQFEQALFYRKSTMDMVLYLHAAWAGAPYDPEMDGYYAQLDRIYGNGQRTRHQVMETRVDRRFWNIINGQRRRIAHLIERGKLTPEQLERLDDRVRVYVEDHMAPEFDDMGDFFLQRKAEIMEQTGLLWDASFRRRLTGYYDMRVCAPYYAAMAKNLEAKGKTPLAAAYREKAKWYEAQALHEFRRSNGDRLLSELQDAKRPRCLTKPQVLDLLKSGLASKEPDARFAAALTLADLGALDVVRQVADTETRRDVADLLTPLPEPPSGLKRGIRARYFRRPGQPNSDAERVLRQVDLGFRGNDRFIDQLRPYWVKEEVFPPAARGQFLLKLDGKLLIPADGRWRFYAKTDLNNRATVRLTPPSGQPVIVISPNDDANLLYSDQVRWGGGALHVIDFGKPIELKKGLVDIEIDYKGLLVHGPEGKTGIRLYWSSDSRVMEIVPAEAFFCPAD